MSGGNPVNNPFGTAAGPSGPVAGQLLELKRYDCSVNTAVFAQQTYIQEVDPNFTIESGDQQVWIHGAIKMYRSSSVGQGLIYAALDHSSDGGSSYDTLCTSPCGMEGLAQNYNTFPIFFVHTPGAGNHRYRIRLYSPSNVTILLGVGNNNGCQMTFSKRHVPAVLLTTNRTSTWTFSLTPP